MAEKELVFRLVDESSHDPFTVLMYPSELAHELFEALIIQIIKCLSQFDDVHMSGLLTNYGNQSGIRGQVRNISHCQRWLFPHAPAVTLIAGVKFPLGVPLSQ